MDHPETIDPSDGQSKAILRILQNKVWFKDELIQIIKPNTIAIKSI